MTPNCTSCNRGVPPTVQQTTMLFMFTWGCFGLLVGFVVGLCLVLPFYFNRPQPEPQQPIHELPLQTVPSSPVG